MALPKKESRKITVDNFDYRWMASGNDGWIDLYIEPENANGQPLKAKFNYHHLEIEKADDFILKQQFVVTPDIVRQTIELGKKEGWNPTKKGKALDLNNIDDMIIRKK